MFLHSASGLHSHEYSPPRLPSNSLPRRVPLTRSAFSAPLPQRSIIRETISPDLRQPLRALSENISPIKEPVVRFQVIEQDTMSEDARSVANSEGSITTAGGGRRKKRAARTSTAFHLAHPAPTLTQKQKLLQIRPKLLLQLQRLSADARPKPSLDVVPSSVVVPRLYKKFPRMFRGKGELGCNDVMIVKSEEYEKDDALHMEGSDSDEESLGSRDLVAVICQMPKDAGGSHGKAEMVLSDGSVWIASPLPNGLYEFESTDDQGNRTVARWVRRSNRRRSVDMSEALMNSNEIRFTFSTIDPTTRRHPILATINQNKLDIPDAYTSIASSAGNHATSSPIRGSGRDEEPIPERKTIAVDEQLRRLIQVTGIWVALRQGWSPYFKYNDAMTTPKFQTGPGGRARAMSMTPEPSRLSPTPTCASTPESHHSTLGSVLGSKIRRVSNLGCPNGSSPQTETLSTSPKRSMSTGTAFMQRAAARRAGNAPSTVASDSEGDSMMELRQQRREKVVSEKVPVSTPHSYLALPGSPATTLDTPTRPRGRPQSYIPPSSIHINLVNAQPERHSIAVAGTGRSQTPDSIVKPKSSGWKSFTNRLRRLKSSARRK